MTGLAEQIKKTDKTLEERGIPSDSFFNVIFSDGTSCCEIDTNWSEFSEEVRVKYFEGTKTVFVSKFPVKEICVFHGDLHAELSVPEGCQAYQSIRSETVITGQKKETRILCRIIGIVRKGVVIEEIYLDAQEGMVRGTKL